MSCRVSRDDLMMSRKMSRNHESSDYAQDRFHEWHEFA